MVPSMPVQNECWTIKWEGWKDNTAFSSILYHEILSKLYNIFLKYHIFEYCVLLKLLNCYFYRHWNLLHINSQNTKEEYMFKKIRYPSGKVCLRKNECFFPLSLHKHINKYLQTNCCFHSFHYYPITTIIWVIISLQDYDYHRDTCTG